MRNEQVNKGRKNRSTNDHRQSEERWERRTGRASHEFGLKNGQVERRVGLMGV